MIFLFMSSSSLVPVEEIHSLGVTGLSVFPFSSSSY